MALLDEYLSRHKVDLPEFLEELKSRQNEEDVKAFLALYEKFAAKKISPSEFAQEGFVLDYIERCQKVVNLVKADVIGRDFMIRDSNRLFVYMLFFSTAYEHLTSILLLFRRKKYGSAFALSRSVLEAAFRGLWVLRCAAQDQIDKLTKSDNFNYPPDLVSQLDNAYSKSGHFMRNIKKTYWKPMCSFAHTGMLQIVSRFKIEDLKEECWEAKPSYTAEAKARLLRLSSSLIVLMAIFLFEYSEKREMADKFSNLHTEIFNRLF
jgi:hypothetical protein